MVGDCYVAQQTKSSSGCYFDMIVLKCNPLDRENPITAKLVYKARIDTGAEILEDCSKLERTKEYRNTEIPFTVPDAYIYDQIYGANDLDAIKAFYCDKTPQALLDQVVSGATPLTVSPQTVPVAKKETEAKTQDKKSK